MPNWQKWFVMFGILSSSLSGIMYLIGHLLEVQRSALGSHHILAIHGVASMLAILALGSVLPFHLKAGYKSKKKWISGFSQLSFLGTLMISGILLYYGPEVIRDEVVNIHWAIGLIFFGIFLAHLLHKPKPA